MTPEYRQELEKTLATLNKIVPAKFQLLSQDIPSETKDLLKKNRFYFTTGCIHIKVLVATTTICFGKRVVR